MRYWWVNQNQTYRHEIQGGYLWSPKTSANNRVNPFYDFMTKVEVGDVILFQEMSISIKFEFFTYSSTIFNCLSESSIY